MFYDDKNNAQRLANTVSRVGGRFEQVHGWKFKSLRTGKVHDLSAADIDKLDYIEENGLFVVV